MAWMQLFYAESLLGISLVRFGRIKEVLKNIPYGLGVFGLENYFCFENKNACFLLFRMIIY
jgi:hypothetical protein